MKSIVAKRLTYTYVVKVLRNRFRLLTSMRSFT